jgi:hypothetical protein
LGPLFAIQAHNPARGKVGGQEVYGNDAGLVVSDGDNTAHRTQEEREQQKADASDAIAGGMLGESTAGKEGIDSGGGEQEGDDE